MVQETSIFPEYSRNACEGKPWIIFNTDFTRKVTSVVSGFLGREKRPLSQVSSGIQTNFSRQQLPQERITEGTSVVSGFLKSGIKAGKSWKRGTATAATNVTVGGEEDTNSLIKFWMLY